MKRLTSLLLVGCVLLAGASRSSAQNGANSAEIKRITDRYALTRARISALLDPRLNPVPLPANPPNPFYQPSAAAVEANPGPGQTPDVSVPAGADESDIDTIRKYAATLKLGGLITRNGTPYLTINNTASKVGDIIAVGSKDHPIYLKLLAITPADFTLGLNDATLVVPLKK